jgi:hypothetical protein
MGTVSSYGSERRHEMKRSLSVFVAGIYLAAGALWLSSAMGQEARGSNVITQTVKSLPTEATTSSDVRITVESERLDLETRVAVLEREVRRLREQVELLVARATAEDLRYTGPLRTPDESSDSIDVKLRKEE